MLNINLAVVSYYVVVCHQRTTRIIGLSEHIVMTRLVDTDIDMLLIRWQMIWWISESWSWDRWTESQTAGGDLRSIFVILGLFHNSVENILFCNSILRVQNAPWQYLQSWYSVVGQNTTTLWEFCKLIKTSLETAGGTCSSFCWCFAEAELKHFSHLIRGDVWVVYMENQFKVKRRNYSTTNLPYYSRVGRWCTRDNPWECIRWSSWQLSFSFLWKCKCIESFCRNVNV